MGTSDTSWTRALMASSGIAIGHDTGVRHASAEWHEAMASDTPLDRLQKLATCREREVRTVIARRPDCPMGILASLAFDHDSGVRAAVAGNTRITQAISTHLAKDRDAKVVKALARNHAIDLELLHDLAVHKKDDVRRVASRNLDERIHDSEGRRGGKLTARSEEVPDAIGGLQLPWELRDRVAAPPEWAPERAEGEAPPQQQRLIETRSIIPRLHVD